MVDVYQIWCGSGHLTAIERDVYLRNRRPSARVGRRFSRDVSSVELRDGGLEIVDVEHHTRHSPLRVGDRTLIAKLEIVRQAPVHPTGRVFQSRCRSAELIERCERGVEVCLVEEFAAVKQLAFERHEVDLAPLRLEALLGGPTQRLSDD